MTVDPKRLLTVTLPGEVWDHITDRLSDYADEAEERPWLGDCLPCDQAAPGMCADHQREADYGAQVRRWRDEIVNQFGAKTSTLADLVRRTRLPMDRDLREVMPAPHGLVRNALMRSGIETLGDLAQRTDTDLLELKHFGPGMLTRLKTILRELATA
ncbi:DNA-directed RNA polymerase subunit alpha C-terminal domain-containing protein [Streptosporangium sp. NPDC049248]|uniref:DNA-directed RNA polymerase subunit alpha C-terminal domain-containing protein n=1 Tax=Streptosporangium sp. NPDC049248 TaxID=3155651 RepID=UPI00344383B9